MATIVDPVFGLNSGVLIQGAIAFSMGANSVTVASISNLEEDVTVDSITGVYDERFDDPTYYG